MKQGRQLGMSLLGVMTLVTVATASENDALSPNDIVNRLTHTELAPANLITSTVTGILIPDEGDYIFLDFKPVLVVEVSPQTGPRSRKCSDGKMSVSGVCLTVMTTGTVLANNATVAVKSCSILAMMTGRPWHLANGADIYAERSDSESLPQWVAAGGNTFSTTQWQYDYMVPSNSPNPTIIDVWTNYTGPLLSSSGNVYCFANIAY